MPTVGILGAGTMGAGIAQIAAMAGWNVELLDVNEEAVRRGVDGVYKQLDKLVDRGRLAREQRDAAAQRLRVAGGPADFAACELIVEAVVEDLELKARAMKPLVAAAKPDAIFASNTSSLSISKIGRAIDAGRRMTGMHFFNPVPLMPLVEVIAGDDSDPALVNRVAEIAKNWGKTVVRAKDTPGFIVNRVARGYYLESLRMLAEGVAGVAEIDGVLKRLGGFKMGPFELMDLIGIDVNYSVSLSVWEQMGRPARLTPHPIQKALFDQKQLGRKMKRGFYLYSEEGPAVPPLPAVLYERRSFEFPPKLYEAVRRFAEAASKPPVSPSEPQAPARGQAGDSTAVNSATGSITEQYVLARVLAAIINEAALALDEGVASQADINTAMKLGTNYPRGPLEWAEMIGRRTCAALLRALNEQADDGRFKPAAWLEA